MWRIWILVIHNSRLTLILFSLQKQCSHASQSSCVAFMAKSYHRQWQVWCWYINTKVFGCLCSHDAFEFTTCVINIFVPIKTFDIAVGRLSLILSNHQDLSGTLGSRRPWWCFVVCLHVLMDVASLTGTIYSSVHSFGATNNDCMLLFLFFY